MAGYDVLAAAADVVAALALLALLVTAYRHPPARMEAGVAVLAAGATLALAVPSGLVSAAQVLDAAERLGSVVLFLLAILVVADVCAQSGLFDAAAGAVVRVAGRSPVRLLVGVLLLAAAVTAVFSLDATAVLLTPVVLAAAGRVGASSRPGTWACLRMANSASLLLPVSNLTNLLALPDLDLTFGGFAARMLPVLVVVLVLELAALLLWFRADLVSGPADRSTRADRTPAGEVPVVPVVVVVAMLAGFALASPYGVDPAWVAGSAAVVLATWGRASGVVTTRDVARAAHPSFALFVLALGVVVAALAAGPLGHVVRPLLPDDVAAATTLAGLLGVAALATVLANLLTNLSATLLLVPLAAPLGDTVVLAALLGLNIGSGLTYSGSLANLLWRRGLTARGVEVPMGALHRFSLVVTPVVLVAAVVVLWATTGWYDGGT